jgi:hypothetical protein
MVLAFASVKTLGTILSAGSMGYLGGSILMSAWGGPRKRVYGLLGSAVIYALGIVLARTHPNSRGRRASITAGTAGAAHSTGERNVSGHPLPNAAMA